jgi:hypothetical protein
MSIFGKREGEVSHGGSVVSGSSGKGGAHAYGIGDVIRLLRTLPVDQHGELVVRVIRTTLESINVHVTELIDDASRQQQKLGDRIGALQAQILELAKQMDTQRTEVARLEADLAETTNAKERLQSAERAASAVAAKPPGPHALGPAHLPPPTPPPKGSSIRALDAKT